MKSDAATVHVARGVELHTPAGEPFQTDTVWFHRGEPATARILVKWHHWERAVSEGLFGLDTVDLPEDLVPQVPVSVDVEFTGEPSLPATQPEVRTRLVDPNDALRQTASWDSTAVQQQHLPDETELTETVFSTNGDAEARSHVAGFDVRQASSPVTPDAQEAIEDQPDTAKQTEVETEDDIGGEESDDSERE